MRLFSKIIKKVFKVFFLIAGVVGIIFGGVFFAMKYGLLNVKGSIEERNKSMLEVDQNTLLKDKPVDMQRRIILCEAKVISKYHQNLGDNIVYVWDTKKDSNLISGIIGNAILQIEKTNPEIKNEIEICSLGASDTSTPQKSIYHWANTSDWQVISTALMKDAPLIEQASKDTGVPERMIISAVIPEQFRFFSSNRESYKRYFEPLKLLGTMTTFSLGVSGIKPDTALQIENHIKDIQSKYYLGAEYEHILDYPTGSDHDTELYSRLTDTKNHYYQYLYTALYIKQIEAQWLRKGYDLSYRPDILSTLFNLGFYRSNPSDHPEVGGASINVGGKIMSFGQIGSEFYFSGELIDIFPY